MFCQYRGKLTARVHEPETEVFGCSKFGSCTLNPSTLTSQGKPLADCASCSLRPREQEFELTIGIPFYRDWQGLSMTLASLRMNHDLYGKLYQIVVIDNDPDGKPDEPGEQNHSFKAKQMCRALGRNGSVIYEHYTEVSGTAAAKGRVFHHATGRAVVVMDCHVIVSSFGLQLLSIWFEQNPESRDLIHGVLLGDGCEGDILATHMNPNWGGLMFGQWGVDDRWQTDDPFEIPFSGCGFFACNRHAWPGFHPQLRGFGPEEFHLHQRVRRNGGKVLCHPGVKWWHRFGNPGGHLPPGLTHEDRLRGHLITHLDTGADNHAWFEGCKRHFIEAGMKESTFAKVWIATRNEFKPDWEPVGDILHSILEQCGIKRSTCPACQQWRHWMNAWGVAGCEANRARILARLTDQAKSASWIETIRTGNSGYLPRLRDVLSLDPSKIVAGVAESILNEAIKLASDKSAA